MKKSNMKQKNNVKNQEVTKEIQSIATLFACLFEREKRYLVWLGTKEWPRSRKFAVLQSFEDKHEREFGLVMKRLYKLENKINKATS